MGRRGPSLSRWPYLKTFMTGLLTGLFLCTALLSGIIYALTERGFTARVELGTVAASVRTDIELQIAELLPGILSSMKEQVPEQVAVQLAERLADASLVVYGVEIKLPPAALADVRSQVQEIVTAELQRSLDTIDISSAAEYWGERGQRMLADALRRELKGRTLLIKPNPAWDWFSLPIILSVP